VKVGRKRVVAPRQRRDAPSRLVVGKRESEVRLSCNCADRRHQLVDADSRECRERGKSLKTRVGWY
jgi:hypothetical protein